MTDQPEQTDPAAVAAARLEAIRRHRRESDRASFIRQIILIAGVLVLAGAVGLIFHIRHRQRMEQLSQEAAEQERRRAADAEERRRQAAEVAARHAMDVEARRQAEDKRLQFEKEQAARRAARAAAEKEEKENAARYRACEDRFRSTTMGRLATAPDSERPDRVKRETVFLCLTPGGERGYDIYEIKVTPGFPMKVERLNARTAPTSLSEDEFKRSVASMPYLLLGGAHVYLRPDPAANRRRTYAVPNAAVPFCPSQIELGGLAEAARRLGVTGGASFSYKVLFRPKGGGGDWPVATIPFDGRVRRSEFVAAVRAEMARHRRKSESEVSNAEVDAVLDEGSALFTVVGGY